MIVKTSNGKTIKVGSELELDKEIELLKEKIAQQDNIISQLIVDSLSAGGEENV